MILVRHSCKKYDASYFQRKILDDDDEDEDYVPMRASNVNLLSDLFRTTDEDTNDEEQESDLKKLSSGLTIRPVESSEEHKTKWVHSS